MYSPGLLRVLVLAGRAGEGIGRKHTHSLCLLCGALGLVSVAVIHDKISAAAVHGRRRHRVGQHSVDALLRAGGIACRRSKTGVYMGIFNFFIVLPEIIASLGFGWVMNHLLTITGWRR